MLVRARTRFLPRFLLRFVRANNDRVNGTFCATSWRSNLQLQKQGKSWQNAHLWCFNTNGSVRGRALTSLADIPVVDVNANGRRIALFL
jgi:hypothetical protein